MSSADAHLSCHTAPPPPALEVCRVARGLVISTQSAQEATQARLELTAELRRHTLLDAVTWQDGLGADDKRLTLVLSADRFAAWTPGFDTLGLCARLGLDTRARASDLQREIWIAMLASPIALEFPSVPELLSAVRVRQFMVEAARKTSMDFQTEEAKRPDDCWTYQDHTGFTVRPGCDLIDAVTRATQPEESGTLYSFSCYRATEYVILLGLAHEAKTSNPALLDALQAQWEQRAVMSGRFHEVFLREYGAQDDPLPITSYIPGDRIWFRNPDDASSDVAGYEGSWVVYLGNGEFPNFWQHDKPFTLLSKCVEVYHWRDGLYRDAQGEPQIDESVVEARVRQTLADPLASAAVLERMFRLRDAKGVYAEGGCMDTTREAPRWVCPGTSDIVLPGMY